MKRERVFKAGEKHGISELLCFIFHFSLFIFFFQDRVDGGYFALLHPNPIFNFCLRGFLCVRVPSSGS